MRKLSYLALAFTLLGVGVNSAPTWAETPTNALAAITILKEVDKTQAAPGDTITYRITVGNLGNGPATNVIVTDFVPANTTYVPNSTTINFFTTGSGTPVPDLTGGIPPLSAGLNIGTLNLFPAAGYFAILTFKVTVSRGVAAGTIITDTAQVISDTTPLLVSNPVQTVVIIQVILAITKTANPTTLDQSGVNATTFSITVTNSGNAPATNVIVRDTLPSGLAYQAGTTKVGSTTIADVGGVSPLATAAGLNVGTIAAGASVTVTFQAKITGCPAVGTPLTDVATVESQQTLPQSSNAAVVTATAGIAPPTITILSPTSGQTFTPCDLLPVQFIVTASCPALNPASIQVLIDNTVVATAPAIDSSGRVVLSIDISNLAPGSHFLTVTAADIAGNVARVSVTFTITCSCDCALELLRRAEAAGALSHSGAALIRENIQDACGNTGLTRCGFILCAFRLVKCEEVAGKNLNRPSQSLLSSLEGQIRCLGQLFSCPITPSGRTP